MRLRTAVEGHDSLYILVFKYFLSDCLISLPLLPQEMRALAASLKNLDYDCARLIHEAFSKHLQRSALTRDNGKGTGQIPGVTDLIDFDFR